MPFCVYKITNTTSDKIYIGFHTVKDNLDDGYMGSGKLIKRAVKFHGSDIFEKEILKVFHSKEEAEAYEAEIVDIDFVMRPDTYNVSLGGNVTILYGENNGFFGKKHTKETIQRIQKKRNKTISSRGYTVKSNWHCFIDNVDLYNISQIRSFTGLYSIKKIIKFIVENPKSCGFVSLDMQSKAEDLYTKIIEHELFIAKWRSETTSVRFKNKPKSLEQRQKMGESARKVHHWWQGKINKNPEKIRKTAEKHRGSKRSEETCKRISDAVKSRYDNGGSSSIKGRVCYHDPETEEIKFIPKHQSPPDGWIKGNPRTKKKVYYDPTTLECKRFKPGEEPTGWLLGHPTHGKTKRITLTKKK